VFQAFEVFEEEKPGGLLGVVELGGAASLLAEDVVNILEGLFEHSLTLPMAAGDWVLHARACYQTNGPFSEIQSGGLYG
jgi:hypothetical protein